MKKIFIFCYLILFFILSDANAQSSLEDEVRVMKEQMNIMQRRMTELEAKVTRQDAEKQVYQERISDLENKLSKQETIPIPSTPTNRSTTGKWTPEIGAVADIVAMLDSSKVDEEGADRVNVRELELTLGSAVDPFSRFDATVAFSDLEGAALEEAYLTRFDLPLSTTGRLGKFKPRVGKALTLHRDSLDTVDEPLVIQKYFGIEGYSKTGVDLTKILDLPVPFTQQVAFGVLEGGNGEDGTAFGDTTRRPTLYGHLKNYADLGEATGLEVGISDLVGSRDSDASFEVNVLGLDTTLTHRLNANQSLKLQAEAFHLIRNESQQEVDDGLGGTMLVDADDDFWGAYGLLNFQFHPQWVTGVRYDYVEEVDSFDNPNRGDRAYTSYLTFNQSEFARWRLQFTHTDKNAEKDDNAVYLQGTFTIGDHKHKLQ